MPEHQVSLRNFKCGIASFAANYIAGVLHPFDVIKTRFQSHDGKAPSMNVVPKYKGIVHALKEIYKSQGLKGLFKGFHMSLFSQAIASALYFWMYKSDYLSYESRKEYYNNKGWNFMGSVSLGSLEAGMLASILTQPFWVIKTRMLLHVDPTISEWKSFKEKSAQVYRQYGWKGFLKGLQINLLLSFLGISTMFFYQGSKLLYETLKIPQTRLAQKNFICGGISKISSGLIMYPLTTVRTRIQQNQFIDNNREEKYKGNWDIIIRTVREEGIRGFYKGLWANVLKGIPQKGIYFYFYELIKRHVFDIREVKKIH